MTPEIAGQHTERAELEELRGRVEQLQHALESRVLIEQAKGVISERYSVPIPEAFELLRAWCRHHNVSMRAAAEAITERRAS